MKLKFWILVYFFPGYSMHCNVYREIQFELMEILLPHIFTENSITSWNAIRLISTQPVHMTEDVTESVHKSFYNILISCY